jgi:hypothetical protein
MVDILFKQKEGMWWHWPRFMVVIVGWRDVPKKSSPLAWYRYVEYRRKVVWDMNSEIRSRKDCRELRIQQATRRVKGGVYWLSKEKAIPTIMAERLQRATVVELKTASYARYLSKALNAPESHRQIAQKQELRSLRAAGRKAHAFTEDLNIKQAPLALMEPPQ